MLHDSVLSFCIFCFSARATGPSAGKCFRKDPTDIIKELGTNIGKQAENAREAVSGLG